MLCLYMNCFIFSALNGLMAATARAAGRRAKGLPNIRGRVVGGVGVRRGDRAGFVVVFSVRCGLDRALVLLLLRFECIVL